MVRHKSRTLTEVELEFMQVMWQMKEACAEEVREFLCSKGRDLSDGTVRKMLSILLQKGYLTRRQIGKKIFVYKPMITKRKARRKIVADMLLRAFENSPAVMISSVLDIQKLSPKEISEVKKTIAERSKKK